jgi:hypothetical protein
MASLKFFACYNTSMTDALEDILPKDLQEVWKDHFFDEIVEQQRLAQTELQASAQERINSLPCYAELILTIDNLVRDKVTAAVLWLDDKNNIQVKPEDYLTPRFSWSLGRRNQMICEYRLDASGTTITLDRFYEYGASMMGFSRAVHKRIWKILGKMFPARIFYYPACNIEFEICRQNPNEDAKYIFQDPELWRVVNHRPQDKEYFEKPLKKSKMILTKVETPEKLLKDLKGEKVDVLIDKDVVIDWNSDLVSALESLTKDNLFVLKYHMGHHPSHWLDLGYKQVPYPDAVEKNKSLFGSLTTEINHNGAKITIPFEMIVFPDIYVKKIK